MKKGFTIIELLVASLLLGMIVTILTMIFNQSSIAWRTAVASVNGLDRIRDNVAELREEADNAFIAKVDGKYQVFRHVGLWKSDGSLRERACDDNESNIEAKFHANMLIDKAGLKDIEPSQSLKDIIQKKMSGVRVGGDKGDHSMEHYRVNVMSYGPDKKPNTGDDIWSWADDFE